VSGLLRRPLLPFILTLTGVLSADGISKHCVRAHASALELKPLPVFGQWFFIGHAQNTGAAWGLWQGCNRGLAALGLLVVAAICWRYAQTVRTHPIAYGLLSGGILGNVLDRLRQGGVTDFIDIHLPFYRWPSFNLADTAICLAVGALLLLPSRSAVPPNVPESS
jgi:signal peptidase II